MIFAKLPRVFQHRQRDGQALIAAAGVDHYRHLAAAHARIGTGRSIRLRADARAFAEMAQKRRAYARAVRVRKPFLCDAAVAFDLPFEQLPQAVFLQPRFFGKSENPADVQAFRRVVFFLRLRVGFAMENRDVIARDARQARMRALELGAGGMPVARNARYDQMQSLRRIHQPHLARAAGKPCACGFDLLRRNAGQHLQAALRGSDDGAQRRRNVDPLHAAAVGHHDALRVFENIPAALHKYPLRHTAQRLCHRRRAQRDADRLRAAQRRPQLLAQKRRILFLRPVFLTHRASHPVPAPRRRRF